MSANPAGTRHDPVARRYELGRGDATSFVAYTADGARQIITHTFVPPELRGRGLAGALMRAALDDTRRQNLRVEPQCSYAGLFIQRHAEYQDLLAAKKPLPRA